jgi:hypothetical protein
MALVSDSREFATLRKGGARGSEWTAVGLCSYVRVLGVFWRS